MYPHSLLAETKIQKVKNLSWYDIAVLKVNSEKLMQDTAKLRDLITKRGTFEMLIPLCYTTHPVRYKQFRGLMKGISSKTLARRLRNLRKWEY